MGLLEDMWQNIKDREQFGLRRVDYGGVLCVVTGFTKDMIKIHPYLPGINIGAGSGMSIYVYEYEITEL